MHLNEYQLEAKKFALYQKKMYPIASLMVEAAELADLYIKPMLRGDEGEVDFEDVMSEAGDVLWNLSCILSDQHITLEAVAQYNIKKLNRRADNGTIQGKGDR